MADRLKACPLCKSHLVSVLETDAPPNEGQWQVRCDGCDLTLPMGWSKEAVVEFWNTRASPTTPVNRYLPMTDTTEGLRTVDSAVELMGEALFLFSNRMRMAGVFASGSALTDANAASYERVVSAWGKLTDAVSRDRLPQWDHYAEEHVTSDVVPRDVAESWKAKAENYQQERSDLLADISDMMANHVDNWPAPKRLKTAIALIGKTLDNMVPKETHARIITDALAEKDARIVAQAAEITMLRQLLDDVRLEASETIPPDGKAAAFVALHQICFMISTRAALENTNDKG